MGINKKAIWFLQQNNNEMATYSDYIPTWTGFSINPTVGTARYAILGKMIHLIIYTTVNGTSNSTATTITLPSGVNARTGGVQSFGLAQSTDNSGTEVTTSIGATRSGGNIIDLYRTAAGTAWTNVNGKRVSFNVCLEID